ncbi:zinc-dependent metalloprotease [Butyricimonas sp.]|uniref:zinc-dependent metalloprotease n=1 Tax=Butyricimonas sp. TaxID=1969738 RepID=UPI0025BABF0B|nr:zinc-dependent metalloprotease [Butyricimonas sp.]
MKRLYVMLLMVAMLVSCLEMTGAERKKKKKEEGKTEQQSKYEELLEKPGTVTAKGGFATVHKVGQKIYLEYPLQYLGREVLLGSAVKSTSDAFLVTLGYKAAETLHLKFELQDSTIWVEYPNTAVLREKNETSEIGKALDRGYTSKFYKKFKVATYNSDSTAVVFEATSLFKNKDLNPTWGMLGNVITEKEDKDSFTFGTIKAFDDNLSVEVKQNFSTKMVYEMFIFTLEFSLGDVTANSSISMLLLPEEKMQPRVRDSRVGVFPSYHLTGIFPFPKSSYGDKEIDGVKTFYLATRWRLEPVDKVAWERGELVDVKKPIIWYVDDAFPAEWLPAIHEGILVWNQAFEKIGLKNVMQARNFPTKEEDPAFDPDNLKYSCIRYVPAAIGNGMGPSWTDPVTGEILNASVFIWSDIAKLVNEWRFVQTAQIDERVRGKKLPADVMHESMVYVIAHEIGHTLGLMHNMSASHVYPVDSLRSVSFTMKNGTTPSIMDYARNNYVAQPEDKGVKLTPPDLGVYDEYVIKWLYSPITGEKNMWEEAEIIEKWVDEKAGDPLYRYGEQQFRNIWDPSSMSEDLGDDPVKAGDYGIKNLKYILSNLEAWSGEEGDLSRRESLYQQLAMQYMGYLYNVIFQVGGVYLTNVKDGTPGTPHLSVAKADQRKAVKWVINELRNCDWLDDEKLLGKLPVRTTYTTAIRESLSKQLSEVWANRVLITSKLSTPQEVYSVKELYEDLYAEAFYPTLQGKTLTAFDKALQKGLMADVNKSASGKKNLFGLVDDCPVMIYPTLDELRLFNIVPAKLLDRFATKFAEVESKVGVGSVAKVLLSCQFSDENGTMDNYMEGDPNEKAEAQLNIVKKINTLAKSKMATAPVVDRAHYELLYRETQKALKIE